MNRRVTAALPSYLCVPASANRNGEREDLADGGDYTEKELR